MSFLRTILLGGCVVAGTTSANTVEVFPTPAQLAQLKAGRATLEQVVPWLDTDQPDLQRMLLEAARSRPDWARDALALLRGWQATPEFTEARARAITGIMQNFADAEEIQRQIAAALNDPQASRPLRQQLLQCLARARVAALPDRWVDALRVSLTNADPLIRQDALLAVKSHDVCGLEEVIEGLSRNADLPPEARLTALGCLAPRQRGWDSATFAFLREQLRRAKAPLAPFAAARVLGASRLSVGQLTELTADLAGLSSTAVVWILPAFGKSRDVRVGTALVAALEGAPAAAVLNRGDLDRVLREYPAVVQDAARPLYAAVAKRHQADLDRLTRLGSELGPGDSLRGKLVFQGTKARCADCHRAARQGGGVGPNLSRIGVIRSHRDLLESIVAPSLDIAPEFRAYIVTTRTGQVHTGLLLQETADAIYLRPAPLVRIRVARCDIEEFAVSPRSLMAQGFDQLLSPQELTDLIEFLAVQR